MQKTSSEFQILQSILWMCPLLTPVINVRRRYFHLWLGSSITVWAINTAQSSPCVRPIPTTEICFPTDQTNFQMTRNFAYGPSAGTAKWILLESELITCKDLAFYYTQFLPCLPNIWRSKMVLQTWWLKCIVIGPPHWSSSVRHLVNLMYSHSWTLSWYCSVLR